VRIQASDSPDRIHDDKFRPVQMLKNFGGTPRVGSHPLQKLRKIHGTELDRTLAGEN